MKHIYGIIDGELSIEVEGVDVYGVSTAGMTAVVSDAEVIDYKNLPQEVLLQHLMAHQQVVEGLMNEYSILPVQFGSLLHDDAQVRRMLESGRGQFMGILDEFQGLIQMELVILWDGAAVFDEIAMELDVPAINASLAGKPAAEIQAKQAEIGQKVQLALAKRQDALEKLAKEQIKDFAQGVVKNPQMDENMAANLGVLLAESAQEALDEALERIDEATGGKYTIRCVGPLPPHSFARISVRAPKPDLIEYARELLGLGLVATPKEMKKAYHGHAYYMHPDRNSDLDSIVKMTELAQSYKMLKELAAGQGGEVCHLDTAAVAESVLITVQRPGR